MKSKIILLFMITLSLAACQHANCTATTSNYQPPKTYSIAVNTGNTHKTKYVPIPMKGQLMPIKGYRCHQRYIGKDAIVRANKKATREPNSGEYINAIMTFDYMPGALYQIYCAPLSVTDIQFETNEHIVSVGAGDTLRWQVSKTFSGIGGNRQEHLLVKPVEDRLTNTLVVTTDQRTYHLVLRSTPSTYMASVTWRYPEGDGIVKTFNSDDDADVPASASAIDLNRMCFDYQVQLVKGPQPTWFPTMVFNDGKKTYIKMPSNNQTAPTLFIGSSVKDGQIVNYRVAGDYYIVDRLFSQAQLRSGQDNQIIVQISYNR